MINLASTIVLFQQASKQVSFPQVAIRDDLVLLWAGRNSRHPGTINITDGKPFGKSQWYGRIMLDGELRIASHWQRENPELCDDIVNLLVAFDEEPLIMLADRNRCAFCGKLLKTRQHQLQGYGSECAKHWQLPEISKGQIELNLGDKK